MRRNYWFSPKTWKEVTGKMPIPAVDVLLLGGELANYILLGKRKIAPYKGLWAFPGGRMHRNETFHNCAKRICLESGLIVEPQAILGSYEKVFRLKHSVSTCVVALFRSGKLKVNGEISEYIWFPIWHENKIGYPSQYGFRIGDMYEDMLRDFFLKPPQITPR